MRHLSVLLLFACSFALKAQDAPSVHQRDWEYYRRHPEMVGSSVVVPASVPQTGLLKNETLNGIIYGFHPYWMNGAG